MRLIAIYCVVVVIGELLAFPVGLLIERTFPSLSMILYMVMFFGVLWGGWILSVFITEKFLLSADEVLAARKPVRP
jgi:hypothetical protein